MPAIEINNLTVFSPNKGKQHILLDDINCNVSSGEILTVIGPNGAGKSTLIRALSGDTAYEGSIEISGLSTNLKLRARQLAVLPQHSILNFPYRVSEVVGLSRIPHQTGIIKDNIIIDEVLELMDISFLKNRLYPELSGGEKQRVQIARVFSQIWNEEDAENGTRILLLDEPINTLDLSHQKDLMDAIKLLSSKGVTIIMVLHDMNLAARYSDRILALLCSQSIAHGKTEDVITAEKISKLFNINAHVIKHPEYGTPVILPL